VGAAESPPIPRRVLDKPPSAELRPDQKDTDTLPPYDVLDPIVEAYVEDDRAPEDIIAERGLDPKLVDRVIEMIDRAEYKRRQAAPGIKITPKAFGRDRRLPITNRYRRFGSP
jgi:NAD+ synthase (glutamine-hydrolysing)